MSLAHAVPAAAAPRHGRATVVEHSERVFVFVSLLLMSQALLAPLFASDASGEGPAWMRMMWFPVYAGTILFGLVRAARLGSVLLGAFVTAPLIILAFASTDWSLLPDVTLRRAVALAFTTFFALYLAARFEWRDLLQMLAAVFLVLALGSCIAALAFPSFGVDGQVHPGAWKGLWQEKNGMGAAMVRGALACACAAIVDPRRRGLWTGAALLCAGLVLASTSKTALLGLLLVGGLLIGIRLLRSGGLGTLAALWLGLVALGAAFCVFLFAPSLFFELLGKDPTLTGRTDIWEAVMRRVAAEPGGHGYAAFWSAEGGPATYIQDEADWDVPNAHNGWLELLLWFGPLGLWLFAANFAVAAAGSVRRLWARGPEAYWALPITALFLLFSASESTVMQWNNLSWVLYVATLAKALQGSAEAERRTSAAP